MKNNLAFTKKIFKSALITGLLMPAFALAANLLLANKPLVESSTSDVLPNLMFIIDDSGSMNQNYTPDWSNSSNLKLRNNSAYNTQYYNPNIRYLPAVKYDGSSMGNQDPTAAKNAVDETGAAKGGITNLVGSANYYYFVPGEYCKAQDLKDCTALSAANATYKFPAPIRWCNSPAAAIATAPAVGSCRSVREETFTNLRSPPLTATSSSTSTITITGSGNSTITSIKVSGNEIVPFLHNDKTNSTTVAQRVRDEINKCTSAITGSCQIAGYSATSSGNVVTITSGVSVTTTVTPVVTSVGTGSATAMATAVTPFSLPTPGSLVYVDINSSTTSYPLPGTTEKGDDRDDCVGTVCTYAEEMINFANWHTYYKTRSQGMKTSASLAFKGINSRYRVGFISIHNAFYLKVAKFDAGAGNHKEQWYKTLFSVTNGSGTPLRSSLSTVGRIFAGKNPLGISGVRSNFDPVEYACQPNFALLTTDGYWNTDADTDVKDVKGDPVGNRDGTVALTQKPQLDANDAANTLADVAKYYADEDIRQSATGFANCTGALGTGNNVCGEEAGNETNEKQTMKTLTLGLGIDGTKLYSSSYKTDTTGDFAEIKTGGQIWPNPKTNTDGERIDDLWHAAVNGDGTYFSARDPKQLTASLVKALSDITSKVGAGSAAAASSLQPTAGDNFNYVASYTTNKWIGNLEARNISLATLVTDAKAQWCAEDIALGDCEAPAKLVLESGQFSCKTSSSNATSCAALGTTESPSTLTGTDCRVPVVTACTGTMAAKVALGPTARSIKFNAGTNTAPLLAEFLYANLNATQQTYFNATALASLAQWGDLTSGIGGQREVAAGAGIVNYLRGQKGLEDSTANAVDDRIFRQREATLGDITESQPAFIANPKFRYTDPGYAAFSTSNATRIGAIYVGANDGMLHAFYAKDQVAPAAGSKCVVGGSTYCGGEEIWAYVPSPVMPKMAKLADRDYALSHVNFVNGDPTVAEVCIAGAAICSTTATASDWRTVLVGGLSGGGRGYYAMDITDPKIPKLLWEFTTANSANLGYSFGNPVVTKLNDGRWVALLTSGYNNGDKDNDGITNNSPQGDGKGYLYVVDINTGVEIKKFPTGIGSGGTPSGLGQIAAYSQDVLKNNLATYVYGGDLAGNLWRFDINAANGSAPLQLATLIGPTGLPQPITTTPQLGVINKKTVVFVGTGKYLELTDLTNTDKQTMYAIKDVGASATPIGNPRSTANATNFVAQVLKTNRTIDNEQAVDFATVLGWRIDMPDAGERFNIDPGLVNGVLLAPTIVPSGGTACSPGGSGWFNYFNYKKGGAIPTIAGGLVSEKLESPAVGFNVLYDSSGKPVVTVVKSNDPTPEQIKNKDVASGGTNNRTTLLNQNADQTYGKKNIWRELIR